MHFKERGFTVGDLFIISIIIISTIFIVNKVKESDKQTYLYNNFKGISRTLITYFNY